MALPVQSFRAKPEHRALLQAVAEMLRAGREAEVRRLIEGGAGAPIGPFRSEQAAIYFMRDRLVSVLKPRMIWLFGSRARGEAKPDSDFDFLVVLKDGLPDWSYHPGVGVPAMQGTGLPNDVVPYAWSDFVKERERPGSLAATVVAEGRLLYQDLDLRKAAA